MNRLRYITLCLGLCVSIIGGAQSSVNKVEYFFDSDPGYGKGMAVDGVAEGTNNCALSLEGLSEGAHLLSVRTQDNSGRWSATTSRLFYLISPYIGGALPSVNKVEYFFDSDPGYGKGMAVDGVAEGTNNCVLSLEGLSEGAHLLSVRVQDISGRWSATISHLLYTIPSYQIVEMEYFFDSDNPEEGSGTKVVLPDPLTRQMSFEVSVDGLDVGEHQFLLRAKGQDGQWSLIQSEPFVITEDITGVREVAWTAPVNIGLDANSNVVVTLTNDAGGKDYQVDVFSSSGKKLVSSLWKNGKYNHVVPMTNATEQVLIVKVSEVGGRKYVIKKLILR